MPLWASGRSNTYEATGVKTGRLELEQLPGYAPELNPGEGIWNYLKRVELRNVCCQGLPELHRALRLATARLRHKRVVEGCFTQYGCAA